MANQDPLIVCSQLFYPELISTGLTLTELCERLSAKSLSITVLCAQPSIESTGKVSREMIYKGMLIKRLFSTQFSKLSFLGKLCNHVTFSLSFFWACLCLPQKSRLLVLTNPPFLPLLLWILYPIKRFRYSVLVFDVYPETLVAAQYLSASSMIVRLWKWLNKRVYASAEQVIVIGRCMKQVLLPYFDKGCSSSLVQLPIWADDVVITESSTDINFRQQWGLENAFIVGYAGNLALFHPIETILTAAKLCVSQPRIHFVFVGNGAKRQWAEDFVATHQLKNCHFFDFVPRDQLGALLKSFDCGVVGLNANHTGLSVPSKTMGLLSAGVPVVGLLQKHCEMARLIQERHCGIVIDPDDSKGLHRGLLSLLDSVQLSHFSSNARSVIDTGYSLSAIADLYFHTLTNNDTLFRSS